MLLAGSATADIKMVNERSAPQKLALGVDGEMRADGTRSLQVGGVGTPVNFYGFYVSMQPGG